MSIHTKENVNILQISKQTWVPHAPNKIKRSKGTETTPFSHANHKAVVPVRAHHTQ